MPLDAGLWVSALDPTGLATARHGWRSLGLPAIASRTVRARATAAATATARVRVRVRVWVGVRVTASVMFRGS